MKKLFSIPSIFLAVIVLLGINAGTVRAYDIFYGPYHEHFTIHIVRMDGVEVSQIDAYFDYYDNPYEMDTKYTYVKIVVNHKLNEIGTYTKINCVEFMTGKEPLESMYWDIVSHWNWQESPPSDSSEYYATWYRHTVVYERSFRTYSSYLLAGKIGRYTVEWSWIPWLSRMLVEGDQLTLLLTLRLWGPSPDYYIQLTFQFRRDLTYAMVAQDNWAWWSDPSQDDLVQEIVGWIFD